MDFKMFLEDYKKEIKNINFKIPWKLIPTHRKVILGICIMELILIGIITIPDYLYKNEYNIILINNIFNFNIIQFIDKFYKLKKSVILLKSILRFAIIFIQFLIINYYLKKGNIKKRLLIGLGIIFGIFLIESICGYFYSFSSENFIYDYFYLELFIWSITYIFLENTKENKKVMNYYTQKNSYKRKKILINLLDKYKIGINDKNNLKFIIDIKKKRKEITSIFFYINIILKKIYSFIMSILTIILRFIFTELYKQDFSLLILMSIILIIFLGYIFTLYELLKILFIKQDYFTEDLEEIIIFNNFFTKIFEEKSKESYS
jgi:membrane protein